VVGAIRHAKKGKSDFRNIVFLQEIKAEDPILNCEPLLDLISLVMDPTSNSTSTILLKVLVRISVLFSLKNYFDFGGPRTNFKLSFFNKMNLFSCFIK